MGISVRRIARLQRIEEVLAIADIVLLAVHQSRLAVERCCSTHSKGQLLDRSSPAAALAAVRR